MFTNQIKTNEKPIITSKRRKYNYNDELYK